MESKTSCDLSFEEIADFGAPQGTSLSSTSTNKNDSTFILVRDNPKESNRSRTLCSRNEAENGDTMHFTMAHRKDRLFASWMHSTLVFETWYLTMLRASCTKKPSMSSSNVRLVSNSPIQKRSSKRAGFPFCRLYRAHLSRQRHFKIPYDFIINNAS